MPEKKLVVRDMPVSYLCLLIFFAGLGWMTTVFILGKISTNQIYIYLTSIGWEILKILFIGTSVGLIVNQYIVRKLIRSDLEEKLLVCNINQVYQSRVDAISEFTEIIQDEKNKNFFLGGISLRDFLIGGGKMREVWEAILDRLKIEEQKNLPGSERLHVRCLLLDPRSSEGQFRYKVEMDNIGGPGLAADVPIGFEGYKEDLKRIFGTSSSKFLEARLYKHCPFSFIFGTNNEVFVEQYYYRDHQRRGNIPLFRYKGSSSQYTHFKNSYNTIWKNTDVKEFLPHHVGVAKAINSSKLINIFRREERDALSKTERDNIRDSKCGSQISILAVTGKHFVTNPPYRSLIRDLSSAEKTDCLDFRMLIANPVSQQAILRAVSDSTDITEIGNYLKSWNWEKHRRSQLYTNVHDTIEQINILINNGNSIKLRLYNTAISCSLIIAEKSIFIEQYSYGRSIAFGGGRVLGGEYPVFEFAREEKPSIEEEVIISHFDVIWNNFSIPYDIYLSKTDEENEFKRNLEISHKFYTT